MYKINISWKKKDNIKNNLLEKGWAKKQAFISEASIKRFKRSRLGQKTSFYQRSKYKKVQAKQIEPKNNLFLSANQVKKGSSEAD